MTLSFRTLFTTTLSIALAATFLVTLPVAAQPATTPPDASTTQTDSDTPVSSDDAAVTDNPATDTATDATAAAAQEQDEMRDTGGAGECAGVKTDYFACDGDGAEAIAGLMSQIMLVMTIGVGIIATGGLVYAGVLYASAQDSQEQIKRSRGVVRNVVIGLLLYTFMIAIIDWLVPGGVFDAPDPEAEQSQVDSQSQGDEATDGTAGDAATDQEDASASRDSSTTTN